MADLDAAGGNALLLRNLLLEPHRIVFFVGRGIELGPAIHHRLQVGIVVDVGCKHVEFEEIAVAVDLALAGFSQNDEFVDVVAARSEEHPSELQSLMRSSYAVFCLNKK